MGLWILALPISAFSFIVGKRFSFISPTHCGEMAAAAVCAHHRREVGRWVGGWAGERKGRMGEMGEERQRALGTPHSLCGQEAWGLSPASSAAAQQYNAALADELRFWVKLGVVFYSPHLSLLYFHLMKIKELWAFFFFLSPHESYWHRLRRRGACLGCCSALCCYWSHLAGITCAPEHSCMLMAVHPAPSHC